MNGRGNRSIQRPQKSRPRFRGRRTGGPRSPSDVLDSSGPSGKQRGTATQLMERYKSMARDARGSSDRIMEEKFLQFADHYARAHALMQAALPPREEGSTANYKSGEGSAHESSSALPPNSGEESGVHEVARAPSALRKPQSMPANGAPHAKGRGGVGKISAILSPIPESEEISHDESLAEEKLAPSS